MSAIVDVNDFLYDTHPPGPFTDPDAGSLGSAQQIYTGASPPAAPDDPTLPALYYPTAGGTMLQWDGAAWV